MGKELPEMKAAHATVIKNIDIGNINLKYNNE